MERLQIKIDEKRTARMKKTIGNATILSIFLMESDPKFKCCLDKNCHLVGDSKKTDSDDRSTITRL